MKIVKATVLLSDYHMDHIILHTDLPSPFNAKVDSSPLKLDFKATKNTGIEYVRKIFHLEPEVIKIGNS